jgi:plasmid stability protein
MHPGYALMMRTTVNLPDDLLTQAKLHAAAHGSTLTRVLEDSLRAHLSQGTARRRSRLVLPTAPGALRPGIDLDDSAALLDLMEAADDSV